MTKEEILTKHGYPETWQSQNLKNAMGEYAMVIAVKFREWCNEKQIPYVRNGYQDLTTEQLFELFNNE